jgi:hypothetical protein
MSSTQPPDHGDRTLGASFARSWSLLSSSFLSAAHNLVAVPMESYHNTGGSTGHAVKSALTIGVPSLLLQPATGIVKASAELIGGLVTPFDEVKIKPVLKDHYQAPM